MAKFLTGAGVGALPLLTLCVFAPLLIYSGNPEEFTASYLELIGTLAPYGLAICVLFGLFSVFMNESATSRFIAVLSALAILLWLQANILVWDYGPLDGHSINWLLGAWRGVLDTVLWIALFRLAWVAHQRYGRWLLQGAIATVVIQLLAAGAMVATDEDVRLGSSSVEENALAKHEVLRFSESSNVLHIVMDGFQTDMFKAIVADKVSRSEHSLLQGFTLFENNVGPYPYTQMTVPALLSSRLYLNDVPANDFVDATLRGQTILGAAVDAGYEVDIAAPTALKNTYAKSRHTNAFGISSSGHVSSRELVSSDSARLIDLSLFRVAPHFVKALVYREDLWLFQAGLTARTYQHIQYFSDLAFITELTEGIAVNRDTPVYKMMHLMLSHRPTVGDENCEYDGRRRTNRDNVTIQARCGLDAILELFARMQELGIYESSLIVLMADHGAWVPVETPGNTAEDAAIDAVGVAMATPVLAVKRPGARHALQRSSAMTSILDVPATIAAVLRLEHDFDGASVFELADDVPRERRHYSYKYGSSKDVEGYLMPLQEFVTDSNPFDFSAWRRGRKFEPEGKIVESDAID